mgnify:CR=1 FL=1
MSSSSTSETPEALESEGRQQEALVAYERDGRFQEAARVAWQMGAYLQAAELSEKAGMHFETSMCFAEAGNHKKALHHLVRSSADVPDYRQRAMKAIAFASSTKEVDLRFDTYVQRFVADAPKDDEEVEALFLLAELYQHHHFHDQATSVAESILSKQPSSHRAISLLADITGKSPAQKAPAQEALDAEMAFRRQRIDDNSGPIETLADDVPNTIPSSDGMRTASDQRSASSDNHPPTLEPGSHFGPRYRLGKSLGRGGMAIVFEADDLELGEKVAIKVFTQLNADEEQEQRFRREVTLARQLTHPNIIRVYDIGKVHQYRFITMELLQGYDLDRYLVPDKPFEVRVAVRYMLQACAGLGFAHKQGVVHRDVKPANFFVEKSGTLKIMDFGIAKHHGAKKVTSTGMILGTPEYISPEQINDFANTSFSTDLYALGIMLYQMVTGRVPFDAEAPVEILLQHLNTDPVPPRQLNAEVPAELESIILKLLAKTPKDRFLSCQDLSKSLRDVLQQL